MRSGVIGMGPYATATHIPAWQRHPDIEFVGAWTPRPDAHQDAGIPLFASFEELCAEVDLLSIAVPPAAQARFAVEAARRGLHLIVEKPVAETAAAAARLAEAVTAAGVSTRVNLSLAYTAEMRGFFRRARELSPSVAQVQWLSGALLGDRYGRSGWRRELGALTDIGPHVVDLAQGINGPVAEVTSAQYAADSDTWTATLTHTNGAVSLLAMSIATPALPTAFRVAAHGARGFTELPERPQPGLEAFTTAIDELLSELSGGDTRSAAAPTETKSAPQPVRDIAYGARLSVIMEEIVAAAQKTMGAAARLQPDLDGDAART